MLCYDKLRIRQNVFDSGCITSLLNVNFIDTKIMKKSFLNSFFYYYFDSKDWYTGLRNM